MAAKFKRKETKMETPSKLNINTGRERQQSLSANPISREVLLLVYRLGFRPVRLDDVERGCSDLSNDTDGNKLYKLTRLVYLENCIQRKSMI